MYQQNVSSHIRRIEVLVLLCILCAACHAPIPAPTPTPTLLPLPPLASNPLPFPLPEVTPGTAELPDFLLSINAGWRGLIFQEEMKSMEWADLNWPRLTALDPTLIPEEEELAQRITFFINAQPQAIQIKYWPSIRDKEFVFLRGEFTLDPGTYEAAIVVQLTSGEILEHRWPFTVVPELVWPGLPDGVYVSPLPESTISQKAHQRSSFIPPQYYPCGAGGICIGLVTEEIVEDGEFLGCGDVASKVRFISLDGRPPGEEVYTTVICEAEKSIRTNYSGQVIAEYPGPHAVDFWEIDLPPGEHLVVAELTRASGEPERFAWRFTITED